MSTLDQPGAFDAFEKLQPGEPFFPLLARDDCAPGAMTEWARLRRNRALKLWGDSSNPSDAVKLAAELAQCAQAENLALEFADWRAGQADESLPQRSSYQEIVRTAEELAEAGRRSKIDAAVRQLREAAYHVRNAHDGLKDLDLIGESTDRDLGFMLAQINGLADEHTPQRPGFTAEPVLPMEAGHA